MSLYSVDGTTISEFIRDECMKRFVEKRLSEDRYYSFCDITVLLIEIKSFARRLIIGRKSFLKTSKNTQDHASSPADDGGEKINDIRKEIKALFKETVVILGRELIKALATVLKSVILEAIQ